MWARVASFEGGNSEELRKINEEAMASGELTPPEGVKRVLLLSNPEGNRRLFIALFESKEAIEAAEQGFEQMGDRLSEDVRGRRTGVDYYEVMVDDEM